MKKLMILSLLFVGCASAGQKHKHQHEAHSHEAGKVSIAFDKTEGKIDFQAPGMAVLGFENEPTAAADQAKVKDTTKNVNKNILDMVQFDSSLKCKVTKSTTAFKAEKHECADCKADAKCEKCEGKKDGKCDKCEGHKEGKDHACDGCHGDKAAHANFTANYNVKCAKAVKGSTITFNVQKYFPNLKNVEVVVLADDVQKSVSVTADKTQLVLQ